METIQEQKMRMSKTARQITKILQKDCHYLFEKFTIMEIVKLEMTAFFNIQINKELDKSKINSIIMDKNTLSGVS